MPSGMAPRRRLPALSALPVLAALLASCATGEADGHAATAGEGRHHHHGRAAGLPERLVRREERPAKAGVPPAMLPDITARGGAASGESSEDRAADWEGEDGGNLDERRASWRDRDDDDEGRGVERRSERLVERHRGHHRHSGRDRDEGEARRREDERLYSDRDEEEGRHREHRHRARRHHRRDRGGEEEDEEREGGHRDRRSERDEDESRSRHRRARGWRGEDEEGEEEGRGSMHEARTAVEDRLSEREGPQEGARERDSEQTDSTSGGAPDQNPAVASTPAGLCDGTMKVRTTQARRRYQNYGLADSGKWMMESNIIKTGVKFLPLASRSGGAACQVAGFFAVCETKCQDSTCKCLKLIDGDCNSNCRIAYEVTGKPPVAIAGVGDALPKSFQWQLVTWNDKYMLSSATMDTLYLGMKCQEQDGEDVCNPVGGTAIAFGDVGWYEFDINSS